MKNAWVVVRVSCESKNLVVVLLDPDGLIRMAGLSQVVIGGRTGPLPRTDFGAGEVSKKGRKLRWAMTVAIVTCAGAVAGLPVSAETLSGELKGLLGSHPQIKSAESNTFAADESINESIGAFFPTLTLSGDGGYEIVDSPGRRATAGEASRGKRNSAAITLNWNIFDGFGKYADLGRTRFQKDAASLSFEATRQNVLLQGIAAYLDVLRQSRLLEFALINQQTIQTQLNLEDERVKRGSGLAVDVLQAKSRLQIAKEVRVSIGGALERAISRYIQVYGHPPVPPQMVDPEIPVAAIPGSLDGAIDSARRDNPALANSARLIDVANQAVRTEKSSFYPRLDLLASGSREQDVDGIIGIRKDVTVQLQATWELFSGFSRQARVARAAHQRAAIMSNHTFVDRQTEESVRFAWHALNTARERKSLLENAVNIAEEVSVARRKLRDAGQETIQNVLDAENEVNNARLQLTAATYDEYIATYQLLGAIGTLTSQTLGL